MDQWKATLRERHVVKPFQDAKGLGPQVAKDLNRVIRKKEDVRALEQSQELKPVARHFLDLLPRIDKFLSDSSARTQLRKLWDTWRCGEKLWWFSVAGHAFVTATNLQQAEQYFLKFAKLDPEGNFGPFDGRELLATAYAALAEIYKM